MVEEEEVRLDMITEEKQSHKVQVAALSQMKQQAMEKAKIREDPEETKCAAGRTPKGFPSTSDLC